jgi:beta-lactamase class A
MSPEQRSSGGKRNVCTMLPVATVLLALAALSATACNKAPSNASPAPASAPIVLASPTPALFTRGEAEVLLEQRLSSICERAQGVVAVAVIHVEKRRIASINGNAPLLLYSVFKLPLAIAVLKEVEANRLKLDQVVHITPDELVPGTPENSALYSKPVDYTISQLIEFSISRSDNTSTDKLLQLIGGPARVSEQMRAFGFHTLDIHSSVSDYVKNPKAVNTGSAEEMATLLTQLQQGKFLQPAQSALLIKYMRAATTGLKRLRANLPAGTVVADKTGSGERDAQTNSPRATNDVGLITLPDGKGTLAVAVLVTGSKLVATEQEQLIAELGRAIYDEYAKN